MIPLGDDLPTLRTPWMTWLIVGVTFAVWVLVQGAGFSQDQLIASTCNLGLVPGELTHLAKLGTAVPVAPGVSCVVDNDRINILTPLISIFLHGSWIHIGGNMLFFWVFGNNVEDAMGPWRFLAFYLVCGLAAAAAHIATNPASAIPTVGASGAISGVLAAYLLLYPRARVRTWIPPIFLIRVPAWFMLILWFLEQVVSGVGQLNQMRPDVSGGVAVWAHVGGFLAGLALVHLFAQSDRVSQIRTTHADLLRGWRPGY